MSTFPNGDETDPRNFEEELALGARQPRRVEGRWWLFDLYVRPTTFFRTFANATWPALTVLCAWLLGIRIAADRIATYQMRTSGSGQHSIIPDDWTFYWIFVVAVGAMSGALYYVIGGWWYRVRVRWSGGGSDTDPKLVRRVYLYASLVASIPFLISEISNTLTYQRPSQTWLGVFDVWMWVFIASLLWSYVVSYRGVREVFGVRRVPGMIWFVALPSALIVGGFVLGVVLALTGLTGTGAPADTTAPLVHRGSTTTFSYPGNWLLRIDEPDFDPDWYVLVETQQDGFFELSRLESDLSEVELFNNALSDYSTRVFKDLQVVSRHRDRYGKGDVGALCRGKISGMDYDLRLTILWIGAAQYVQLVELCRSDQSAYAQSGFDLIQQSLKLEAIAYVPGSGAPPNVSKPKSFRGDMIRFDYPANWELELDEMSFEPESSMMIQAPQDAVLILSKYQSINTPEEEIQNTLDTYTSNGFVFAGEPSLVQDRTWKDSTTGEATATLVGVEYVFRITVAPVGGGAFLECVELCRADEREFIESGFELMLATLEMESLERTGAAATR